MEQVLKSCNLCEQLSGVEGAKCQLMAFVDFQAQVPTAGNLLSESEAVSG